MMRRSGIVIACGAAALVAMGCQEEIRRYEIPKPEANTQESPHDESARVRLLAVMAPHGERTWFFKLLGPTAVVDQQQPKFDEFVHSVRFTTDAEKPLSWKVPDGWQAEAESSRRGAAVQRYATFRVGPKEEPAELTVIALGQEAGSLLANVNRWRGQISLRPISETELSLISRPITVDSAAGTIVDMTAYRSGKGRTAATRGAQPAAAPSPVTFTTPEGWREVPAGGGMRAAAFVIPQGDRKAEVSIVPLSGPAGGLLDNVNRWRGQIGLGPVSDSDLRKDLREIDVGGTKAPYIDLVGTEAAGGRPERILAVMIPRGSQTWFIKMWGPADLVLKQKAAFEAFVRSIQFAGGTGANHG